MMSRPDWIGGEPQADLVEQRQQERHSADAQAGEKAAAYRGAEGANAKQAQLQQRIRNPPCMQQITREQRERNRQQSQDFADAQRMFTEDLQHIRQQSDAGTEEDEPHNIERMGFALRDSRADAYRPSADLKGRWVYSRRR